MPLIIFLTRAFTPFVLLSVQYQRSYFPYNIHKMDIHDEKEWVFDIENKKISLAPKPYSVSGACAVVDVNAAVLDVPFLLLKKLMVVRGK